MSNNPVLRGRLNIYTMKIGDGRELELSVVEGYICWRRVGDESWIQLVPLSALKGDTPKIGVDYWTEEDKAQILEYVENSIGDSIYHKNLLGRDDPDAHPMESITGLLSALDNKVEILNQVQAGAIMVASAEDPTSIECSGVLCDDLVKRSELVSGIVTITKEIHSNGETSIPVPDELKEYTDLSLYHNGMLLVRNVHYTIFEDKITLINHTTYAGDLFTFVGYGCMLGSPGSGDVVLDHVHSNLGVLNLITQEKIDKWDAATNPIEIFRVNGVEIPINDRSVDIQVPTTPEDIKAAPIYHSHEEYVKSETLFNEKGIILSSLLPESPSSSNIIEIFKIADEPLPIVDKSVNIPIATEDALGVVRSSSEQDKATIEKDGTISINKISATKLVTSDEEELLLIAGGASS